MEKVIKLIQNIGLCVNNLKSLNKATLESGCRDFAMQNKGCGEVQQWASMERINELKL